MLKLNKNLMSGGDLPSSPINNVKVLINQFQNMGKINDIDRLKIMNVKQQPEENKELLTGNNQVNTIADNSEQELKVNQVKLEF